MLQCCLPYFSDLLELFFFYSPVKGSRKQKASIQHMQYWENLGALIPNCADVVLATLCNILKLARRRCRCCAIHAIMLSAENRVWSPLGGGQSSLG